MAVDESFKKPGAVPFKWEIEPGVPKHQERQQHHRGQHHQDYDHQRLTAVVPLKPPPSPRGLNFLPPPEPRALFSSSSSRTGSVRWRVGLSTLARPEVVSSGCFPSKHLVRKKLSKIPVHKPDYTSDPETHPRRSLSSRNSISPPHPTSLLSSASVSSSRRLSDT